MESVEDTYITLTSAPPSMVVCNETNRILGLSVEGAIMHVLKALEVGYYYAIMHVPKVVRCGIVMKYCMYVEMLSVGNYYEIV
jgi:hypothetical protein